MSSTSTKAIFDILSGDEDWTPRTFRVQPRTSSEWLKSIDADNYRDALNKIARNTADDRSIISKFFDVSRMRWLEESTEGHNEWIGLQQQYFPRASSSFENVVNDHRVDSFHERYTQELLNSLKVDPVEPGLLGPADEIVSKCLGINALATTNWLNALFINNFHRPSIAADLLLLVGRLPYDVTNPVGVTMAIGGFNHTNAAVQEAAIRAFENWANPQSLKILTNVQVKPEWLKNYLDDVVADLKLLHEATG